MGRLAALATLAVLASAAPAAAQQDDDGGCASRLPVSVERLSPFALAYRTQLQFRLRPRATLRDVRVDVFSFGGQRIARERVKRLEGSRILHLNLRSGLRAGGYTVVLAGRETGGCPRTRTRTVLRLRSCVGGLGVQFPRRPGGTAGDYERFLTFRYRTGREGPVRRASATLFTFSGLRVGRVAIKRLEGEGRFTIPLRFRLARGGYTMILRGYLDQQPFGCGAKEDLARVFFR